MEDIKVSINDRNEAICNLANNGYYFASLKKHRNCTEIFLEKSLGIFLHEKTIILDHKTGLLHIKPELVVTDKNYAPADVKFEIEIFTFIFRNYKLIKKMKKDNGIIYVEATVGSFEVRCDFEYPFLEEIVVAGETKYKEMSFSEILNRLLNSYSRDSRKCIIQ